MTFIAKPIATPKPVRRATISDVAQALGVTKSTVSRALNGYPDISEATRLRVKRMAQQMNYHPLSQAQAIRTGRARALGLVLQLADHDAQRPFLAEFLAGLSESASQEGYTLTVASADDDRQLLQSFSNLAQDAKADGFILPRALRDDARVRFFVQEGLPFVLYGRPESHDGCAWFDIRGEDAMEDAVTHLVSLGHSRIGFINGGSIYCYAAPRRDGFERGMTAAGLEVDPNLIAEDALTQMQGAEIALRFLLCSKPPTAIICAVDHVALGVYEAARSLGLRIGQDLSVIGYDGIQEAGQASPPLSTFAVDNRAAGASLARLLIRRIRGEPPEKLRETTTATFLRRGSTGPAPDSEI